MYIQLHWLQIYIYSKRLPIRPAFLSSQLQTRFIICIRYLAVYIKIRGANFCSYAIYQR